MPRKVGCKVHNLKGQKESFKWHMNYMSKTTAIFDKGALIKNSFVLAFGSLHNLESAPNASQGL